MECMLVYHGCVGVLIVRWRTQEGERECWCTEGV